MNYAIDREKIIKYVLKFKGVPAENGPLPVGMPGFSADVKGYNYDKVKAIKLFEEAGYPNGRGLTLKLTISNEETSKLMGVEGMNMGTYTAITKPDGSLEGVGEGVFATLDGEFVTWRGMGVGHFVEAGAVRYTGMLSYSTTSAKLAKLNAITAMFEFDVDAAGKTRSKIYDTTAKAAHA